MAKKYIVRLSEEERKTLEDMVKKGKAASYKRLHAQALLKADVSEQGEGWKDAEISKAFNISVRTVERLRQRLVEKGLDAAIARAKSSRTKKRKLDGEQEAYLIALACSEAPDGHAAWTFQLLADKLVELKYTDSISRETVRKTLKKKK